MSDNKEGWDKLQKLDINKRLIKRKLKKAQGVTTRHAHKFIIKRLDSARESQQNIAKWIFMVGVLIAATGLQLMWYQNNYRTNTPANNGIYAEAVLGPADNFNPIFADTSTEQSVGRLLFSRILSYDKSGHLNYDLAKSVIKNEDKSVITVKLKPGVLWHDSKPLTANDVVFTVQLIKNPTVNSAITGFDNVSVKLIDDLTVEFSTKSNLVAFEHLLTFPILPKHLLADVAIKNIRESKFSTSPIGSGPFKLKYIQDVDQASNRKVVYLTRHQDYYAGTPKIERFQVHIYNDSESIRKALAVNEVNAAADLPPINIDQFDKNRYNTVPGPLQSGVYAIINTTSDSLKDINLRRSLRLATDRQALKQDMGAELPLIDLPLMDYHLSGDIPKAPAFNINEAKKILDDNGWTLAPDGGRYKDGQELKISIVVMKDVELEKVLDILSKQWQALGIKIETKIFDASDVSQDVVRTVLQPRAYDILIRRLFIGSDPDVYAYWHSSQTSVNGLNLANYSSQTSDDALATARARFEPDLRNAKYLTFINQWLEDVPAIGLYQSSLQYISVKDVNSFNKDNVLISATDRYADILDWSVGQRSVFKTP